MKIRGKYTVLVEAEPMKNKYQHIRAYIKNKCQTANTLLIFDLWLKIIML